MKNLKCRVVVDELTERRGEEKKFFCALCGFIFVGGEKIWWGVGQGKKKYDSCLLLVYQPIKARIILSLTSQPQSFACVSLTLDSQVTIDEATGFADLIRTINSVSMAL